MIDAVAVPACWRDGVAAAWLWAARRQFLIEKLHFRPEDDTEAAKRPVVVFYGPSQVGKTGLILRLLGLKEEFNDRVDVVLRGMRSEGESATVTALRYGRSSNDHWEVPVAKVSRADELEFETKSCGEETAKSCFRQLRTTLTSKEHGHVLPDSALWVGLPGTYFSDDLNATEIPVMVDLPGEGSSDLTEARHVPALIRKWLFAASTVVLVENIGLGMRLQELKFGGEQANGWLFWGGDLALALTRAFEDNEVRGYASAASSPEDFARRIREPIRERLAQSGDPALAAHAWRRLTNIPLLPLDFGRSFADLQRDYPSLCAKVEPWRRHSIELLAKHIREHATLESVLLSMTGAVDAAVARFAAEIEALEAELRKQEAEELRKMAEREGLLVKQAEVNSAIADLNERAERDEGKALELLNAVDAEFRRLAAVWTSESKRGEIFAADDYDHTKRCARKMQVNVLESIRSVITDIAPQPVELWSGHFENDVQFVEENEDAGFGTYTFFSGYYSDAARNQDWAAILSCFDQLKERIECARKAAQTEFFDLRSRRRERDRTELLEEGRHRTRQCDQVAAQLAANRTVTAQLRAQIATIASRRDLAESVARDQDPFLPFARRAFADVVRSATAKHNAERVPGYGNWLAFNIERHGGVVARTCAVMKMHRLEYAKRGGA